MKGNSWRRLFDGSRKRRETTVDHDFAEVLETTRAHIAEDFPNPQREGCPARGAVFNSFRNGKMPNAEDRAHILSCSECFNEYQILLAEYRAANRVVAQTGGLGWLTRIAIPALAFGLVIAAVAIIVWKVSVRRRGDDRVIAHTPAPGGSPSSSPSPVTSVSPDQNRPEGEAQKQSANPMLAANEVTIDFEEATALRRQSPQQSKPISLSATSHALLIKLPENSPRGTYTVTLNNAFGKSVRSKTTASANGKTLRVVFNLTGVNSGGYSICVTREQEVPSCLPVTIRSH